MPLLPFIPPRNFRIYVRYFIDNIRSDDEASGMKMYLSGVACCCWGAISPTPRAIPLNAFLGPLRIFVWQIIKNFQQTHCCLFIHGNICGLISTNIFSFGNAVISKWTKRIRSCFHAFSHFHKMIRFGTIFFCYLLNHWRRIFFHYKFCNTIAFTYCMPERSAVNSAIFVSPRSSNIAQTSRTDFEVKKDHPHPSGSGVSSWSSIKA